MKVPAPEDIAATDQPATGKYEAQYLQLLQDVASRGIGQDAGNSGDKASALRARNLGRLIVVSRKLFERKDEALFLEAILALSALKAKSAVELDDTIEDIEYAASWNSPIYTLVRGAVYSVVIVSALLGIAVAILTYKYDFWEAVSKPMLVSAVFGVLGSVVSLMQRLPDFEKPKFRSPGFVLASGAALPLVGAVFALVICAMFQSGIINMLPRTEDSAAFPYFFVVTGFLSGFSERFVGNLLGKAEGAFTAAQVKEQTAVDAAGTRIDTAQVTAVKAQ